MATTAYGSITITDLLDTATYIYYSHYSVAATAADAQNWHTVPITGDKYIGIYTGAPMNNGQPAHPTDFITQLVVSQYVGDDAEWFFGTTIPGNIINATVGSMYLNTATSDIYKLTSIGDNNTQVWTLVGNIADGTIKDCILDMYPIYYAQGASQNTVSGSIVSFDDVDTDNAINEMIVDIEAVQEGTSDASPANERSIVGWSSADITDCGKNFFKTSLTSQNVNGTQFTVNPDDSITISDTPSANISSVEFGTVTLHAGTYKATGCSFGGTGRTSTRLNVNNQTTGTEIGRIYSGNEEVSFTLTETSVVQIKPIILTTFSGTETFYPMIRLSSITDDIYEPYNAITTIIPFGDTYYGGSLNVTGGVMTVTHILETYDGSSDEAWAQNGALTNNSLYIPISNSYKRPQTVRSNILKGTVPTASSNMSPFTCCVSPSSQTLLIKWDSEITPTTFKAALAQTNMQVLYELDIPQTVQLSATQIQNLVGQNNIWANSGDINITYTAIPQTPNRPEEEDAPTLTNDTEYGHWTLSIPKYNNLYPYYYSCYEYLMGDGSYRRSNVLFDSTVKQQAIANKKLDETILNVTSLYYVTGLFSKQVTGTSIHITDADDKNALEHLTITIPTPIQEGSGTASPTNNRPLIGWNGGNLYVSSTLNTTDVTIPVIFTDFLYGGKIDIISGQRIKTHQYLELDGSLDEEWIIEDKGTSNQRFMMRLAAPAKAAGQQLSNKFIYTSTSSNQSWGKMNLGIDAIFYDSNQEFVDDENAEQILNFVTAQDKFRTWLQQNPVQLYYQLAAALTTVLDPIENVFLLSNSENYIWFDQNLNIEIEYLTAPNTPNSPNEHVQNFNLNYNEWTTMIPKHDINYPYHYICYEYFHSNGTYTWSDVILDEAITGTIKDFRRKTNNLGYLLASTNAKYITGQDNLTGLVSASYKTLEGLKTSTSEVKQTIDQFNVDFNDTLSGMQSSFTFHRADQDDPEAYITIQTKNIDNAEVGKVYSRIGSETYQFRKSSDNEEVFTIDTDGTTGRRADVTSQIGIGSGSVANYTEQWAIRKGSNQSSNGSYYDLQIVWVGGDAPSTT